MKIKYVEITGLNGSKIPVKLDFNEDLNIITGRNGAGKTTILKLIWYVISGKADLACDDIDFKVINIITDKYDCTLSKNRDMQVELKEKSTITSYKAKVWDAKLAVIGSSFFFSTFRRLEGGFIGRNNMEKSTFSLETMKMLELAMKRLTQKLTLNNHEFIISIDVKDVQNLLYKQYSETSKKINEQQSSTNQDVFEKLSNIENDIEVLEQVREQLKAIEDYRSNAMKPFESLQSSISKFFNAELVMGDFQKLQPFNSKKAIYLENLSAGEKQILSFLVYNTFYQDTIFIIDEPELSLHVDWQRQLFPTLMKQGSSNQFIVATHSPFIYSKYPDKELPILEDRGDSEAIA